MQKKIFRFDSAPQATRAQRRDKGAQAKAHTAIAAAILAKVRLIGKAIDAGYCGFIGALHKGRRRDAARILESTAHLNERKRPHQAD